MTKASAVHLSDLRGLARMATDATLGVTDLVEPVHQDISQSVARPLGLPRHGIAGLVYGGVRGVTRLVGGRRGRTLSWRPSPRGPAGGARRAGVRLWWRR